MFKAQIKKLELAIFVARKVTLQGSVPRATKDLVATGPFKETKVVKANLRLGATIVERSDTKSKTAGN